MRLAALFVAACLASVAYMAFDLWGVGVVVLAFGAFELIPWVVRLFRSEEATPPTVGYQNRQRGTPRSRKLP